PGSRRRRATEVRSQNARPREGAWEFSARQWWSSTCRRVLMAVGLVASRAGSPARTIEKRLYARVSRRKEGEVQLCRNRDGAIRQQETRCHSELCHSGRTRIKMVVGKGFGPRTSNPEPGIKLTAALGCHFPPHIHSVQRFTTAGH